MATTSKRFPVSERAVLQRINRKLKGRNQQVRLLRASFGYYRIDLNCNRMIEHHVNLEQLGRKLDVLAGWEEVTR